MRGCAAQKADDRGVTHVIVGDKPEGLQGLKPPKRAKVVQVSKIHTHVSTIVSSTSSGLSASFSCGTTFQVRLH
jgi:hypothetical protein